MEGSWKSRNQEKANQINREYRARHKDELAEKARQKRKEDPKAAREKANRWYSKHRETELVRRKDLRQQNLTSYRQIGANSERARRARKKSLRDDLSVKEWRFALEWFGNRCAACGYCPDSLRSLAIDHWIPLASPDCPGHIAGNVVPLCHGLGGCNNTKSDKDAVEWAIDRFGELESKVVLGRIMQYFNAVGIRKG